MNIKDIISLMTGLYFSLHLLLFLFLPVCTNACEFLHVHVAPSFHCLLQPISLLPMCNFRDKLPSKHSCISSVSNSSNWVINDGCRLDTHKLLETSDYRNCMSDLRLASGCTFFFSLSLLYFLFSRSLWPYCIDRLAVARPGWKALRAFSRALV